MANQNYYMTLVAIGTIIFNCCICFTDCVNYPPCGVIFLIVCFIRIIIYILIIISIVLVGYFLWFDLIFEILSILRVKNCISMHYRLHQLLQPYEQPAPPPPPQLCIIITIIIKIMMVILFKIINLYFIFNNIVLIVCRNKNKCETLCGKIIKS